MDKQEFLSKLRAKLFGLPQKELEERLSFYSEMIDDRIEEGLSEEDAVKELGTVDEVAGQIIAEIPLSKLVKERIKPKRALNVWEIVLLVIGSPIWLSLLIAVFAVALSVYVVLWALVITVWAIDLALIICPVGGIAYFIVFALQGNILSGVALLGAGIVCAGLSVLLFVGCKKLTKGTLRLTKVILLGVKRLVIGKEKTK